MFKKIVATLSVGFMALFLTGCDGLLSFLNSGQLALDFNDKMIELQESTLPSAEDFGAEVGTALSTGEINADVLNAAYETVQNDFSSAYENVKNVDVPDVEGAEEFHKAMIAFLDIEKNQVIDVYFKQILDVMLDDTLSIDEQSEEVISIFDEIALIEDPAFAELQSAQVGFAALHEFELE